MLIKVGTTDVITYFKLVDPSTGVPETGLTVTDLDLTYIRDQAAAVKADALAHGAVTDAHTDLECIEIDGTNAPGIYRVDWPDAAFAVNVKRVQLVVNGAAIDSAVIEVELTTVDLWETNGRVDMAKVEGGDATDAIQAACDAAVVANNLDHLCLNATGSADMTTEVADDTILSRMIANGDTSAFIPSTDGLQLIRDAITAAAPVPYHPDASSTITVGNEDSGTYASCAAADGTHWTIGDENGTWTIDVTCEFNMGASRIADGVIVKGYFNRSGGGGYKVEIYGFNYTTSAYVKISAETATTEMRDRANNADYTFALGPEYTDPAGTPGEVKIRFVSTRPTTAGGDVLYLDHVQITGISDGGLTSTEIAAAVHTELDGHFQHIPSFTGSIRYVDGTNGSDANGGHIPIDAFATITAAVTASSAGDYLKVLAGTYAEAVTLAANGLELHGEIGVEITGAGGTPLTISANHCKVDWIDLTPAAGQTGCVTSGDENHMEYCQSHDSGAIGFQVAATGERNHFIHCYAAEFTGTGFDVKGFGNIFTEAVATGNGGTEKGFHLSNTAAHRNVFDRCDTVDCATAGWTADSGADDNLFISCADSAGCGARLDSGTNNTWRDFMEADVQAVNTTLIEGSDATDTIDARVNAQVLDVLNTDTFAEPGQGAPAATTTLVAKIGYLYKYLRNKITTTSTQISVLADDASTVDQKSTISDDGTTFTRGEFGTGP